MIKYVTFWNKKTAECLTIKDAKSIAEFNENPDYSDTRPVGVLFFNPAAGIAKEIFGSENIERYTSSPDWVRTQSADVGIAIDNITEAIIIKKNVAKKAALTRAEKKVAEGGTLTEAEQEAWDQRI